MASVKCLHFNIQEEDILKKPKAMHHMCILSSTCRALFNIDIHLVTSGHSHAEMYLKALEHQRS